MPTQQNDIYNENFSVNTGSLKKTKQDELNENLQEEDEQIDNEFFILLCSDLMSDDCNVGARNDEDVFVYWICLTLAQ